MCCAVHAAGYTLMSLLMSHAAAFCIQCVHGCWLRHCLALIMACIRSTLALITWLWQSPVCGEPTQVIEKALKKLKLDAMIIQQGRLSDNKASVNKDDLLSMVRYGAEMVFSGGGGTITDEDIDAIIAKVTNHITIVSTAC